MPDEDDMLDLLEIDPEGNEEDETEDPAVLRERLRAEREAREIAQAAAERERQRADDWLRGAHAQKPGETRQAPLGPMPDPVEDREAFARWQAEKDARAQAALEARLEARDRAQAERDATTTERVRLWERFREKYPSLASREALAGAAYRELHAAGRLPQGTEAIVDAVRAEMTRLAGGKPATRTNGTTPDKGQVRTKKPGSEGTAFPSMAETIIKRKQELGLI